MTRFYYVDESGNTGCNLFDKNQPTLYYGVLSSKLNLDVAAKADSQKFRTILGLDILHAVELSDSKLVKIASDLNQLNKKFDLKFDIHLVSKPDHALISFFDQVFDSGINQAVPCISYWTGLRFVLLLKIATLFDEKTLRKAGLHVLNYPIKKLKNS